MSVHTGITRSSVQRNHALIAPESHVMATFPDWHQAEVITLISAHLGAHFTQYMVQFLPQGGHGPAAGRNTERFLLVLEGSVRIEAEEGQHDLAVDGYAYFPPGHHHRIIARGRARILCFEKHFEPIVGLETSAHGLRKIVSNMNDVPGEAFLGDPDAILKHLLPDEPGWDMALNTFQFAPGGTLPQVEVHVMEHGLYVLEGQGVYRLGDNWYPVQKGDTIWMAPYLPQWFVASGKHPTRYIYYKDMNRDPALRIHP